MPETLTAVARGGIALACASLAAAAQCATVDVAGSLFDIRYDNAGFLFEDGTTTDPDTGAPIPVFTQYGGFGIVAPGVVRYWLRPEELVPDPVLPGAWIARAGGQVEVGGAAWPSDSAADAQTFTILPHASTSVRSVRMVAVGTYDNSGTESAALTHVERIDAAGASDGLALSLGVFSAGPLPTGSTAAFAARGTPFDVSFSFELAGVSSDPFFTSWATIEYVDFEVSAVPEPGAWALWLGGLLAVGSTAARRRGGGGRPLLR